MLKADWTSATTETLHIGPYALCPQTRRLMCEGYHDPISFQDGNSFLMLHRIFERYPHFVTPDDVRDLLPEKWKGGIGDERRYINRYLFHTLADKIGVAWGNEASRLIRCIPPGRYTLDVDAADLHWTSELRDRCDILENGGWHLNITRLEARFRGHPIRISPQYFQFFLPIVAHYPEMATREQILEGFGLSPENAGRTRLPNTQIELLGQLEAQGLYGAFRIAHRKGYVLTPEKSIFSNGQAPSQPWADELGTIETHEKSGWIFIQGDKADSIYLVKSGYVAVNSNTRDGEFQLHFIVGPGEFFGMTDALEANKPLNRRGVEAMALTGCELRKVSVSTLTKSKHWANALAEMTKSYMQRARDSRKLDEYRSMTAQRSIPLLLMHIWERYGHSRNGQCFIPAVSYEIIGSILCMAPSNVRAVLPEIKKRRIVSGSFNTTEEYHPINPDGLRQFLRERNLSGLEPAI